MIINWFGWCIWRWRFIKIIINDVVLSSYSYPTIRILVSNFFFRSLTRLDTKTNLSFINGFLSSDKHKLCIKLHYKSNQADETVLFINDRNSIISRVLWLQTSQFSSILCKKTFANVLTYSFSVITICFA